MAEADPSLQRLERRRELVRAHVDCENQHDFDGILQTFGTAVAYEDQAWRTRYPGSEGVRLYYEEFLRACADLRIKVHAEHVCTETIILEVTISGTHTGSWHGLLATARRFEIPLCAVYSFDCDDQLAGERIYYDRATVFAQLGVFREPIGWFGRIALVLNHPLTIGRSVVRMVWKWPPCSALLCVPEVVISQSQGGAMHLTPIMPLVLSSLVIGAPIASAEVLNTHRIPAVLAAEAASESIGVCAKQGYLETAVVVDADGATIVTLRGDGAGIHTLDSAHDKAYTSVSFKSDTIALEERGRGEIAPLSKLPHVLFFGGGVVIKLGDETIGAIGASGAPGAKLDDTCARAGLEKIRERLK